MTVTCQEVTARRIILGVRFCARVSKNLNVSRTKQDKFVKQKAFCGEGLRLCSVCLKNAVIFFLSNEKNKFLKKIVNIHVLLLTLLSRLQLFVRRTGEKMSYKFFSVWYTAKKLWMCLPFFFFRFSRYLIFLLVAVRFHSGFVYASLREADTSTSNSKVSTASATNICKQPWANRSDYSTFLPL